MIFVSFEFVELSSTLEPDWSATTDKLAILGDDCSAKRWTRNYWKRSKHSGLVCQLANLLHNFLFFNDFTKRFFWFYFLLWPAKLTGRKGWTTWRTTCIEGRKTKLEQQIKAMPNNNLPPSGFMAPHLAAYQAWANKMPFFPGYGYITMWQP